MEDGVEASDVLAAQDAAVVGDGYLARLLTDDYRHGVADLADTQRGAVAQAHLPVGEAAGGQGQHAGRGHQPVLAHDDGSVMQLSMLVEDGQEQFGRRLGVEDDAGVDVLLQAGVLLEDDQRAVPPLGEAQGGILEGDDDRVGLVAAEDAEVAPGQPQLLQRAAQFGLEDDRDGEQQHGQHVVHQPVEGAQVEDLGQDEDEGGQHQQAAQYLHGPRAANQHQHAKDDEGDEQDVDKIDDADEGESFQYGIE